MNWTDTDLAPSRPEGQERRSGVAQAPEPQPSPLAPLEGHSDKGLPPARPLDEGAVPVPRELTMRLGAGGGSLLARLERALLKRGMITEEQLEEARRGAALRGMSVMAMLVDIGALADSSLAKVK